MGISFCFSAPQVETVGEEYLAVTGLPEPQADHATICVRFALDCMRKLSEMTTSLAEDLGSDTATLKMRVGLHSGPGECGRGLCSGSAG